MDFNARAPARATAADNSSAFLDTALIHVAKAIALGDTKPALRESLLATAMRALERASRFGGQR